MLFEREKIISFGPKHKYSIDLNRLSFNTSMEPLKPLKQLGQEILTNAKFWILYLTLASPATKSNIILNNGLSDLAVYEVENTCDNRILLANFLPEDIDEEEV